MKKKLAILAGLLLLLIVSLFTACTENYDPPDENLNFLKDDVYFLCAGINDTDSLRQIFIWYQGEVLDVEVPRDSLVGRIYVENEIKYFFPNSFFNPSYYYIEDKKIEIPSPGRQNSILGFEVFSGKVYAFGYSESFNGENHLGYWVDGVPHEVNLAGSFNKNGLTKLTTNGTDVCILSFDTDLNYYVHQNGELLYSFGSNVRVYDITYADGHLYACGQKEGKGAIWIDGELWQTDYTPYSYGSYYSRIEIQDGHVFTLGVILNSNESYTPALFRDASSLVQITHTDRRDFELGEDIAYLFVSHDQYSDFFIKVNNITQDNGITVADYYFPKNKGYHYAEILNGSINHIR